MPGIVTLRHLAAMRYRPRPGRPVRRGLAAIDTPVRIREVSAAEMTDAGRIGSSAGDHFHGGNRAVDLHAHGGHLWARYPLQGASDLGEAMLRRAAEGPARAGTVHSPEAELAERTPIHPVRFPFRAEVGVLPEHHLATMRVVHDGVEQARSDLREWLDGNMLLVSGVPHIRFRGPLLARPRTDLGQDLAYFPRSWVLSRAGHVTVPGRASEHLAFHGVQVDGREGAKMPFASMPVPEADGLDDLLHVANAAPVALLSYFFRDDEMTNALLGLSERGLAGGVGYRDLAATLDFVAACADSTRVHSASQRAELDELSAYVRRVCLPALAQPVAPEDAEAMEGLDSPWGTR